MLLKKHHGMYAGDVIEFNDDVCIVKFENIKQPVIFKNIVDVYNAFKSEYDFVEEGLNFKQNDDN
jgi:ASC-1-like (ASCH) protein